MFLLQTGDEMSKRAKFVLITWTGPDVPPLKKAKVSTDKALVKKVIENFSCEIQTSDLEDISLDKVRMVHFKTHEMEFSLSLIRLLLIVPQQSLL